MNVSYKWTLLFSKWRYIYTFHGVRGYLRSLYFWKSIFQEVFKPISFYPSNYQTRWNSHPCKVPEVFSDDLKLWQPPFDSLCSSCGCTKSNQAKGWLFFMKRKKLWKVYILQSLSLWCFKVKIICLKQSQAICLLIPAIYFNACSKDIQYGRFCAFFLGKTIISEFMVYINTSLKRKKVKMVFLLVCYSV